ncbi:MAG: hypothetical protein Q9206_004274 [Seirophora lacunosa]
MFHWFQSASVWGGRGRPEEMCSSDKNQGRCPEHDRSSNPRKALFKRDCGSGLAHEEQLLRPAPLSARIPAGPGSTGYEAIRMRCDLDVVHLSALTAMHIGKTTVQPLQASPSYIIEILRWKQWSYLSNIPLRYGNTKCLDEAVCCLAARVGQWITGAGEPSYLDLMLYSKAVQGL